MRVIQWCNRSKELNVIAQLLPQRRSSLESTLHSIEVELESVRVQLEEECEARLDLERQVSKANSDALNWKSKFESESAAHSEEVEEMR